MPFIAVQQPNGDHAVAVALNEEEYLEKETSSDDNDNSDDDITYRVRRLGFASDSEAQLNTKLLRLKQLSRNQ